MSLRACEGCQRHIRKTSTACPFCGIDCTSTNDPTAQDDGAPAAHPGRAKLMVGVGVGLGALAVSTVLFGTACAVYGGPPDRSDAGTSSDTGSSDSN